MKNDNNLNSAVPPQQNLSAKSYIANYELNEYEYDQFWIGRQYENESEMMLLKRVIEKYSPNKENENIVDLGGAYGRLSPLYRDAFKDFILTDYSTRELSKAKSTLTHYQGKMNLVALNVYNIPFKNETVDNILCVRLIHHIATPDIMLKETARIMKPGGIMVLEVAHKNHLLAFIKALFTGKLGEYFSNEPKRIKHNPHDSQGIRDGQVSIIFSFPLPFIEKVAKEAGFEILHKIPCSFFRNQFIKKFIPLSILLKLESLMQQFFSWFRLTPSIFFVLRKEGEKSQKQSIKMPEMLQCPKCGENLDISPDGTMKCQSCGEIFYFRNGIYDLRDPKPEAITF